MLRTRLRVVPHIMRACLVSRTGLTQTLLSSSFTSTSPESRIASSPSLPFALISPWASETVTPLGTATGFLPTRDIVRSSEHAAENFAADIGRARLVVRHDAPRRGQDRDAETVVDARNLRHLGIDPTARPGDARDLADRRMALVIFELDLELDRAALLIAADVALALQHVEHAYPQLGSRADDRRLARLLTVADPGQHIPQGIAQCHDLRSPYQLDLTMPGIWPTAASSRSAIRDSLNLR